MLNHLKVTRREFILNSKVIKKFPLSDIDDVFIEYVNINKISKEQILLLERYRGLDTIIIMYYYD